MKITIDRLFENRDQQRENGSAVLIVFALLVIVISLVVSGSVALGQLQRELRLIEYRQLKRSGAITSTNQPAAFLPKVQRSRRVPTAPSRNP